MRGLRTLFVVAFALAFLAPLSAQETIELTREQIIEALETGSVVIELPPRADPELPPENEPETDPEPDPGTEPEEPVEDPTEVPEDPVPPPGDSPFLLANEVTYRSIRVRFSEPVEVYFSLTGCPVVRARDGGAVTVVEYDPPWNGSINGAHLNPRYDHAGQALASGSGYPHFKSQFRVSTPFKMNPRDKVLIARTYTVADAQAGVDGCRMSSFGVRPHIRECFPLVVLSQPPPAEFFRPGLAADGRSGVIAWSDINFALIDRVRLAAPPTGPPNIDQLVAKLRKPWASYTGAFEANGEYTTWQTSYHSTIGGDYGRDRHQTIGDAIVASLLDIPSKDKRRLLEVILQQAIDFDSILRTGSQENPVRWGHSRGGISHGLGSPLFLLYLLTGDDEGLDLIAGNRDLIQEFSQTAILTDWMVPLGYDRIHNLRQYALPWAVGDVVWADTTVPKHRINGSKWTDYQTCCTASTWHDWWFLVDVLPEFSPELGDLRARLEHPEMLWYLDVHDAEAKRLEWPETNRVRSAFVRAMWDRYRDQFGEPRFVQPSQR